MSTSPRQQQIETLEHAFWQSMVDGDHAAATAMLTEPAVVVGNRGVNTFDHAAYAAMARNGDVQIIAFTLSRMAVVFPRDDVAVATYHVSQDLRMQGEPMHLDCHDSSTWVLLDGGWKCVVHTESIATPAP